MADFNGVPVECYGLQYEIPKINDGVCSLASTEDTFYQADGSMAWGYDAPIERSHSFSQDSSMSYGWPTYSPYAPASGHAFAYYPMLPQQPVRSAEYDPYGDSPVASHYGSPVAKSRSVERPQGLDFPKDLNGRD